jgi:flagellar biosynthesis protein FlhF
MAALSVTRQSATLIAFPGAPSGHGVAAIAAALRAHRLPELLAAQLLRAVGNAGDPLAALAQALAARMRLQPLNLERAHGVLLMGVQGAGKSTVAAAIAAASPRETLTLNAREGLARFRAGELPDGRLVVMEADGFHPLNPKARGAYAALNDIAGVETIGVVPASGDAEDVAETIAAFRFKRIIVTGLDRTRRLGALAAAVTSGASLAHLLQNGTLATLEASDLAEMLLIPRDNSVRGAKLS